MDKVMELLAEKGVRLQGVPDDQVKKIARQLGIDVGSVLPRSVEVVDYTNKAGETNRFVKTEGYNLGTKANGKPKVAQGLFLQVGAIDMAIEDLQRAKAMLAGK